MNEQPPQEIVALEPKVKSIVAVAEQFIVASTTDVESASATLKGIADMVKGIESVRKDLVKPLNDHVKHINGIFKPYTEPLGVADKTLRAKVSDYLATTESTERIGHATTRQVMEITITDITKVPKKYMTVDMDKVKTAVDNGILEIAGLDIHLAKQLVIK